MKAGRLIHVVAALVVLVAGFAAFSLFVVEEGQQVVITQFGKPWGDAIKDAGLNFKWPWMKANYFSKKILQWDGSPAQIPTKDKKYIWVDTTARWRISDPLLFMQSVTSEARAQSRLDGIIDSVARDLVSKSILVEIVRKEGWEDVKSAALPLDEDLEEVKGSGLGREKITRKMLGEAAKLTPDLGIELVDVRIKRINYVQTVQKKVFDRMISERKRIAAQYRSEGEGAKAAILGKMGKELKRINSEAYKEAQEIKGKADAEATGVYARAFGKDIDFYTFFRTLEAYQEKSFKNSTFVLGTDSEFYKLLKGESTGR
jgi:membrane protease subunit HflC